jgi:cell surface protein SprA
VNTKAERDSIKNFAQDKIIKRTLDISNVKVNITSKTPMPYDPSNFSLGFSNSEDMLQNAATQYERQVDMRFLLTYRYSNPLKPWKPFAGGGGKGNNTQTKPANTSTRPSQGRPANNAPKSNNPFKDFGINFLPQNISVGSNIQRNYFESQLRDINNMGENMIPASFREDFIWNRDLTVQWNLLTDLNLDLRTGTEARIDAPHVQVNKKYNYDDYGLWKDSVMQSIKNWGSPMDYAQQFSGTYAIPFKYIPVLNFIQANLKYSAEYHWDRGANINPEEDEPIELGNTIRNSRTIELNNVNLNLLNLYNKSKFLEEANKKFTLSNKPTNNSRNATKAPEKKKNEEDEKKKKKFEKEVQLRPDTTTDVIHSLNNKRIRITARGANGKLYTVKYKKIDANSIRIENKDTTKLQLVITQLPPLEDEAWYKYAQIAARGLMMVRTISFSYSETAGSMIPGFRPEIGDFFGQGSSPFGTTPGLDFAFGLTGEDYLEKASKNDWLVKNLNNSNPAMFDKNETFTLNATLEPFAGMKITLDAGRTKTHASEVYYMYDNATPKFNGTFMMTTIALKSAFEKVDAANGYYSRAFTNFLKNREVIAQRLNRVYGNAFADAGIPYSDISLNSSDVLVPAFFAAYTGRNVSTTDLSFFPALTSLLPNWKITYDGLIQLPIIKKYFKSFALEHKYECHYAIGSYNAYSVWSEITDGIGFIQNELSDRPSPSSPYNIMGVNIKESFNPLFGIRSSFLNNMSLNFSYGIERNVNLNIASYQIIELDDVNWKTDFGYRFENFNKILKLPKTGGENFNNDLNLSISANYRKTQNLIRMIQDADTQASKGDSQIDISLKADYNMSRMLTFQAFFDRKISTPLVSATAFPLSTTNFGISLKINLSR